MTTLEKSRRSLHNCFSTRLSLFKKNIIRWSQQNQLNKKLDADPKAAQQIAN